MANRRFAGGGTRLIASQVDPKKVYMEDAAGNKQMFSLRNKIEDEIYDTVAVPAGALSASTPLEFFRDLNQKMLVDTNMGSSRKLLSGSKMLVRWVGIYFPMAVGNILVDIRDVKKIVDGGMLNVKLNDIDVAKGQLYRFPIGYGLYGMTTRTDSDVFSNGIPSTASIKPLAVPTVITSAHDVQATLEFNNRAWDAVVAAAPATTTGHVHVRLILKGVLVK